MTEAKDKNAILEQKTRALSDNALDFECAASFYINHYGHNPKKDRVSSAYSHAANVQNLIEIFDKFRQGMEKSGAKLTKPDFGAVEEILQIKFADFEDPKHTQSLIEKAMDFGKKHANLQENLDSPLP